MDIFVLHCEKTKEHLIVRAVLICDELQICAAVHICP